MLLLFKFDYSLNLFHQQWKSRLGHRGYNAHLCNHRTDSPNRCNNGYLDKFSIEDPANGVKAPNQVLQLQIGLFAFLLYFGFNSKNIIKRVSWCFLIDFKAILSFLPD